MKKLFLLLIIVGITFLSCSDNLDSTIVPSHIDNQFLSTNMPSITKMIDGEVGDVLVLNETYVDMNGSEMNVHVELRIPPNSFPDIVKIIIVPNFEDLSIQFYPEMSFNNNLELDLVFTGISTKKFCNKRTASAPFAYFADNCMVELIENDESSINTVQRTISVENAKLSHFSRYGWIR